MYYFYHLFLMFGLFILPAFRFLYIFIVISFLVIWSWIRRDYSSTTMTFVSCILPPGMRLRADFWHRPRYHHLHYAMITWVRLPFAHVRLPIFLPTTCCHTVPTYRYRHFYRCWSAHRSTVTTVLSLLPTYVTCICLPFLFWEATYSPAWLPPLRPRSCFVHTFSTIRPSFRSIVLVVLLSPSVRLQVPTCTVVLPTVITYLRDTCVWAFILRSSLRFSDTCSLFVTTLFVRLWAFAITFRSYGWHLHLGILPLTYHHLGGFRSTGGTHRIHHHFSIRYRRPDCSRCSLPFHFSYFIYHHLVTTIWYEYRFSIFSVLLPLLRYITCKLCYSRRNLSFRFCASSLFLIYILHRAIYHTVLVCCDFVLVLFCCLRLWSPFCSLPCVHHYCLHFIHHRWSTNLPPHLISFRSPPYIGLR